MDSQRISEIAEVMRDMGLTRVALVEPDGTELELERQPVEAQPAPVPAAPVAQPAAQAAPAAPEAAEPTEDTLDMASLTVVSAPMVGVFYAAPSPGADPFVRVGDRVKAGQTLCIVEAMKVMNEVVSEVDGEVVDICVEDGDLVEYGSCLMKIN